MFKKGPKEKEKILKRLTEKEIQDQLYSFRAKEAVLPKAEPVKIAPAAPVIKEKAAQEKKNPYLWLQIVLLSLFIILIWVSVRQIIKIVSKKSGPVNTSRILPKQKYRGQKYGMARH